MRNFTSVVLLTLIALLLAAAGCGPKKALPDRLAGWDETPRPPEGMRMTLLTTGWVDANYKDMVKGGHDEEVSGPVIVALIEHPMGNLLVDLGWGSRHAEHIKKFPASLYQRFLPPSNFDPATDSAFGQLPSLGVEPESVRWLLVTHMHWDHIGGLQDFPDAVLVVPHAEWEAAHRSRMTLAYRGFAPSMYEPPRPASLLIEWPDRPFATFERSHDLFGDGSIVLVDTAGHTPGSMSVFVTLPSGDRFFFIGDAAWVRDNYRIPAHKSWKTRGLDNSRRGVMPTLRRIKRLEELAPEVTIIPAHDPHLWPELKHAPEWYE